MSKKYTKKYKECLEKFKELCGKLIEIPNKEDLKMNNLPTQNWFVKNYPESIVDNYVDFVKLVFNPSIPVSIPIKKYEKIIGESWKPTKTYHEYILIFKFIYNEIKRSITLRELKRHDYGLPSIEWFIKNSKENIKTYNDFLDSLGLEPIKYRKYTYEIAFEEFAKYGFYLPPQEYTSCAIPLKYICPYHPDIIQKKSLNNLLFGGEGCFLCNRDRHSNINSWKGGYSSLGVYLREFILDWKKKSMFNCNYKCVITGDGFNVIHHLYSFNKILREVVSECELPVHTEIGKYSSEELHTLKIKIIEMHEKYPLGVCLCKKVHTLYHKLYGDDNTPEQFEEFKQNIESGLIVI